MRRKILSLLMCFLVLCNSFGATVNLSWEDNSNNENGFRLERATGAGAYAEIATIPNNITVYTDNTPAYATTYSYRIRAYNAAGNSAYSNIATVTTPPVPNLAPTISDIPDLSININSNTGPIAFIVGDAETAVASLTLAGVSSNVTLVPNANIVFGGSGANRTVTITPVSGQIGATTIGITVSDGVNIKADTFVLTVNQAAPNAPSVLTVVAQ